MEVFNIDQDQLNSNLKTRFEPSSSGSPVNVPSATKSSRQGGRSGGDVGGGVVCENCRRIRGDNSGMSVHAVNLNISNNNNNNNEEEVGDLVETPLTSSPLCCMCRHALYTPSDSGDPSSSSSGNGEGTSDAASEKDVKDESSSIVSTTSDVDINDEESEVRHSQSPSPSPGVMSLATTPVGFTPSSSPTPAPISNPSHLHDSPCHQGALPSLRPRSFDSPPPAMLSSSSSSTSTACPHLLTSLEGTASSPRSHVVDNLNRQPHAHLCHACGPATLPDVHLSSSAPAFENDELTSSSDDFPMPSSPHSPSPSGPIPIPSRTTRRHRQSSHHHHHPRPQQQSQHHHHHHQFSSSSLSASYHQGCFADSGGGANNSLHLYSPSPSEPTVFSSSPLTSSLSSSSSAWRLRDLSGFCSSEPSGRLAFFPQQSPKYFKQPSSSQDFALKYPGSDRPSAMDQWPRSAAAATSRWSSSPTSSRVTNASSRVTTASSRVPWTESGSPAFTSSSSPRTTSTWNGEMTSSLFSRRQRVGGGEDVSGRGGKPILLASRHGGRVAPRITVRSRSSKAEAETDRQSHRHGGAKGGGGGGRMDDGNDDSDDEEYERRLPEQFLDQLHQFEHQNEDLSADVVFSLEDKGYNIHQVLGKYVIL